MSDREKRLERALRIVDRFMSENDTYEGAWINYPDKPEKSPASVVREALADDAAGDDQCPECGGTDKSCSYTPPQHRGVAGADEIPCPKHTKGNGPCYCQPTQHRGATEELNELLEYFRERTLTVAQNLSKSDLVRDEALDMVGRIDRARRHLTASGVPDEDAAHDKGKAEGIRAGWNAGYAQGHNDANKDRGQAQIYTLSDGDILQAAESMRREALAQHSEPGREECGWSLDDEDYYQTDCGTEFETVDFLTLEEMPSMKYCANCGRRIRDDSPAPDADERGE